MIYPKKGRKKNKRTNPRWEKHIRKKYKERRSTASKSKTGRKNKERETSQMPIGDSASPFLWREPLEKARVFFLVILFVG